MDDRRTALAIFLCIIVVVVYSETMLAPLTRGAAPAPVVTPTQNPAAPSGVGAPAAPVANQTAPSAGGVGAPAVTVQAQLPTAADFSNTPVISIETDPYLLQLSTLGGRILKFETKNYRKDLGSKELVNLINQPEGTPFPGGVYVSGVDDALVKYEVQSATESLKRGDNDYALGLSDELVLTLKGTLPNGLGLTKRYSFHGNSYLFEVTVTLDKPSPDGSKVWFEWDNFVPMVSSNERLNPHSYTLLDDNNKINYVTADGLPEGVADSGNNRWVSFGGKYFMTTLIPADAGPNTRIGRTGDLFIARVGGTPTGGTFTVYPGPKDYSELKRVGFDLHRNIDLGWFTFLAFPLLSLIRLFYEILHNYGLAIILLTLVIKAAFLPLTKASFKSMQAMQDLQPEVKALRERIKDPTQLNQEMMALYKKRGVNPMGGCLPILIQLPVFLGLYNALLNSIELRHAPFALWITDLSSPERLEFLGIGIPVMVILMGLSMFVQQWTTPSAMDPAQKKIMMMMPIVFTIMFIIFPFPAGLVLYWLVNNIISIIQQVYLRSDRKASPAKATAIASVAIFLAGYLLTLI